MATLNFFPAPNVGGLDTVYQDTTFYCSPSGDNRNDGRSWEAPKKTAAAAYLALGTTPGLGGTVKVSGQVLWSDGTESTDGRIYIPGVNTSARLGDSSGSTQGMWFNGAATLPAGFTGIKPVHWLGTPWSTRPFGAKPVSGIIAAPTGDRFHPAFWLTGGGLTMTFENLGIGGGFPYCPMRIGWDYPRNADGTLMGTNVTAASRAAGVTTLTIALQSYSVISARRSGGQVVMTLSTPGTNHVPWGLVTTFRLVNSPSGSFPNGTYTSVLTGAGAVGTATLYYADGGGNVGETSLTGAFARNTGAGAGDLLETAYTNPEFISTAYWVRTATIDSDTQGTLTVTDNNAPSLCSASASGSNIGVFYQQDRSWGSTALNKFINCAGQHGGNNQPDNGKRGPGCDVGGCSSFPSEFEDCYFDGLTLDSPNVCLDPDYRGAAMFAYGGGGAGAAGVKASALRFGAGGLNFFAGGNTTLVVNGAFADISVGVTAPPTVRVAVNPYNPVPPYSHVSLLMDVNGADSAGDPAITLFDQGLTPEQQIAIHCARVEGPCSHRIGCDQPRGVVRKSPWSFRQTGTWAGGLAGFHPGVINAGSPRAVRIQNQVKDYTHWTATGGATLTPGFADPFGGLGAVKLHVIAGGTLLYFLNGVTVDQITAVAWTHAVGDRWAFGFRAKAVDPANAGQLSASMSSSPADRLNWDGGFLVSRTPIPGDGEWQTYRGRGVLTHADMTGPPGVNAAITGLAVDIYVYEPWILRSPAGAMTDNDWAEYVDTYVPTPNYLAPGIVGTGVGQKLVGHGGLATAKRYTVGAGSGQITIGAAAAQAIEVFDESGTSLGILRPNAFTVNP